MQCVCTEAASTICTSAGMGVAQRKRLPSWPLTIRVWRLSEGYDDSVLAEAPTGSMECMMGPVHQDRRHDNGRAPSSHDTRGHFPNKWRPNLSVQPGSPEDQSTVRRGHMQRIARCSSHTCGLRASERQWLARQAGTTTGSFRIRAEETTNIYTVDSALQCMTACMA